MISAKELKELSVDDVIEADGLLKHLTVEPVKFRVREIAEDGTVNFVTTWCGVTIGATSAKVVKGQVKWQ